MATEYRECPVCGDEISVSNLSRHVKNQHPETMRTMTDPEPTMPQDEQPRPRPAQKAAKKSGGRRKAASSSPPLAVQLQLPYELLAQLAASRGLQYTAGALHAQAPACAQAWDQFLNRFPAFKEMIEKGMIAGDIVGLIMAHLPILQAAQMEMAAAQQAQQAFNMGAPAGANAAAA